MQLVHHPVEFNSFSPDVCTIKDVDYCVGVRLKECTKLCGDMKTCQVQSQSTTNASSLLGNGDIMSASTIMYVMVKNNLSAHQKERV